MNRVLLMLLLCSLHLTCMTQVQNKSTESEKILPRLVTQIGHNIPINVAAFSPDGSLIITGDRLGTAVLWDVQTQFELRRFSGHAESITALSFSPDGSYVLTVSSDKSAILWDLKTGIIVKKFQHAHEIKSVAFSRNGKYIVTGATDNTARIWDVNTGMEKLKFEHEGLYNFVNAVDFSPDGTFVITGCKDKYIKLWDIASGKEIRQYKGNNSSVKSLSFSSDGNNVFCISVEGIISIWDYKTGQLLRRIGGHSGRVDGLSFLPGNEILATCDLNSIMLWEMKTGKLLRTIKSKNLLSIAVSNDGRKLFSRSWDGEISELDLETGTELSPFLTRMPDLVSVAYSADFKSMVIIDKKGYIQFWDIQSKKLKGQFQLTNDKPTSLALSPVGDYMLIGCNNGETLLFDEIKGKIVQRLPGHSEVVHSVAYSPDGCYAVTGGFDGKAVVWKLATGTKVHILNHNDVLESELSSINTVMMACFSPDGRFILTLGYNTARIWELATGLEVGRFLCHYFPCSGVFWKGTRYVIIGDGDGCTHVWDWKTNKDIQQLGFGSYQPLTISRDGKKILSNNGQGIVRLWDGTSGLIIREMNDHSVSGSDIDISKDNSKGLTVSENIVHIWNLISGEEIGILRGTSNTLHTVKELSTKHQILVADENAYVYKWDLNKGEEVFRSKIQEAKMYSLAFTKDDDFMLTAGGDGIVRQFLLPTMKQTQTFVGHKNAVKSIAISLDHKMAISGGLDQSFFLWDLENGTQKQVLYHPGVQEDGTMEPMTVEIEGDNFRFRDFPVAFMQNDHLAFTGGHVDYLWNIKTGKQIFDFGNISYTTTVSVSPDSKQLLLSDDNGKVQLYESEKLKELKQFWNYSYPVTAMTYSPQGDFVIIANQDGTLHKLDSRTGKQLFHVKSKVIRSLDIPKNERYFLSANHEGTTGIWDINSGTELLRLSNLNDGTWIVMTPEGRFETNRLETIQGIHWIMPDDPLHPLPPEIFMRDYYEPRLLPRILAGEKFKPIRPLMDLNRVQPRVNIIDVKRGNSPDVVNVTVEVNASKRSFQRDGKDVVMRTGVHDLRLYRNGQLVGQWPEPEQMTYKSLNTTSEVELNAWRKATEIKLNENGKALKTITVRLPQREDLAEVEFTAYAFNLDRVKSETSHLTYKVPSKFASVKGRAYIITVGVSGNEDLSWRLIAPAQDAKLIQKTLAEKLVESKKYEKVVQVPLITVPPVSDLDDKESKKEREIFLNPSKENIKTVIDLLAGRNVNPSRLETFPTELRNEIRPVKPEDMVFISFSSHGVTDSNGEFYILPYNLGTGSGGKVTSELLNRSISSQELSLWLSGVDTEQIYMVIDACHSGAAVEMDGFKPGPMGNPGLGQLSYDKSMPILAATQATEVAWAKGYSLLTYALVKEGIEEGRSASIYEALKYAEGRVPKLYEEMVGKEDSSIIQEPKLFDFKRTNIVY